METVPLCGSKSRSRRALKVLLPLPVGPMIAVIDPGLATKLTPSSTGRSAS